MKKSKKNYIAIVLIVLLLALAVGYAAFSQTLKITGTATANSGKWDVKFTAADASASIVTVDETLKNSATFTADTVTAKVYLNAPGDGSNITATITNAGELDAKLTGFTVKGINGTTFTQDGNNYTSESEAIVVKVPPVTADGTDVLAKTQAKTFTFSVEWLDGKTVAENGETVEFEITFTYEQTGVNGKFNGTQSFN